MSLNLFHYIVLKAISSALNGQHLSSYLLCDFITPINRKGREDIRRWLGNDGQKNLILSEWLWFSQHKLNCDNIILIAVA